MSEAEKGTRRRIEGRGGGRPPPPSPSPASQSASASTSTSGFLPEPFPTASRASNVKSHFHDAFGENDSGVDYGPPNEFEDACDDDDDFSGGVDVHEDEDEDVRVEDDNGCGNGEEEGRGGNFNLLNNDADAGEATENQNSDKAIIVIDAQKKHSNQTTDSSEIMKARATTSTATTADGVSRHQTEAGSASYSVAPGSNGSDNSTNGNDNLANNDHSVSIEELEEEVGLHEATLESLTSKLSNLTSDILQEKEHSAQLRDELGELLNGRKVTLQKRTDNNTKLVKELEGSLERCLERLTRALDVLNEGENIEDQQQQAMMVEQLQLVSTGNNELPVDTDNDNGSNPNRQGHDDTANGVSIGEGKNSADISTAEAEAYTSFAISKDQLDIHPATGAGKSASANQEQRKDHQDQRMSHANADADELCKEEHALPNDIFPAFGANINQNARNDNDDASSNNIDPVLGKPLAKKGIDAAEPQQTSARFRWQPPAKNAALNASSTKNIGPISAKAAVTKKIKNAPPPPDDMDIVTYANIPLDPKYYQTRGDQVSLSSESPKSPFQRFPSSKLVRKVHNEVMTLPVDFPTWRTHPLAGPLLGGIDSASLIVDIMNATVLERLWERKEQQESMSKLSECKSPPLPSGNHDGGGWVEETDIWGTSLDVYAHVNWKHVCAGFRRVDECKRIAAASASSTVQIMQESSPSVGVDPNVILCPYELGGTCADDRCPYQHLRRDKDGEDFPNQMIALRDTKEGCIWYNNFPKVQWLRCFTKEDFIVKKHEVSQNTEDVDFLPSRLQNSTPGCQSSSNQGRESEALASNDPSNCVGAILYQQQQSDNRQYHCPSCVDGKTYNQEELKAHMSQCNDPSPLTVDGKEVTIRHILRDPKEGDFNAKNAMSGTGDRTNESEQDSDDASMASQGSNSSGNDAHKHPMSDFEEQAIGDSETAVADDGSLEEQSTESKASCDVQNNLDYVSLPSLPEEEEDGGSNDDGSRADNDGPLGDEKGILEDTFWWQQHLPPWSQSENIEGGHDDDNVFDHILSSFGFQRQHNNGSKAKGKGGQSLRYVMRLSSDTASTQQQRYLLFSRVVDLSRLCVHMGHYSFALSAIGSITSQYSRATKPYDKVLELLKDASRSIQQLSHSRCSMSVLQVQVHLLLVSECLHAHHDNLGGDKGAATRNGFCLETLRGNSPDTFAENNLVPASFVKMFKGLTSRLPSSSSSSVDSDGGYRNGWDAFVQALRLIMEKFVLLPFSQIETNQQISFLMQCICVSKCLGFLVRNTLSKERGFSPYLHVLEPIWSSLQILLQQASSSSKGRCQGRWLYPDTVAIIILGPVLFGCVADTIAPPSGGSASSSSAQKLPPKFDARALANVTSLDNFIMGILKELSRFGRRHGGKFVEPLMAPLYALTSTICIALGSMEKARLRLEHVLNKESTSVFSSTMKKPSLYALSEMIWSQLVQIRMVCPSYSVPLKLTQDSGNMLGKLSLPDETLESHQEIASRIFGNGVVLWGVKLRGDSHMDIIPPCFNETHCNEWKKVVTQVFVQHPMIDAPSGQEAEQSPFPEVEFRIFNAYPELDGIKGRASVFPESLLPLGKTLTKLCLENCGLTKLPFSIGHHLTQLQLLHLSKNLLHELPSSIGDMTCLKVLNVSHNRLGTFPQLSQNNCASLRVINVSHNQLESFPADLALRCHNLQSFHVDGNPASDVLPPPQKRQKK